MKYFPWMKERIDKKDEHTAVMEKVFDGCKTELAPRFEPVTPRLDVFTSWAASITWSCLDSLNAQLSPYWPFLRKIKFWDYKDRSWNPELKRKSENCVLTLVQLLLLVYGILEQYIFSRISLWSRGDLFVIKFELFAYACCRYQLGLRKLSKLSKTFLVSAKY